MSSAHGPTRVRNDQTCALRFIRQPIFASWRSKKEIAAELWQGRLENPGILAVRRIKVPERPVSRLVPAGKAEQLAAQRFLFEERKRFIEIDVCVGNEYISAREVTVRMLEQFFESKSSAGLSEVHLGMFQHRIPRLKFSRRCWVFDENGDLVDVGIGRVAPQTFDELLGASSGRVIVKTDK